MTAIRIYDCDAEAIQKTCEDNDMSEHELVELLLEHLDEVKEDYDLK